MGEQSADMRTCEYCDDEFRGKRGLRIHQGSVHDEETTTHVSCNWCGEDVETRVWKIDERQYCSSECSKAWKVYLKRGENHPNYVDGSARGREFKRVRMAVRWRDEVCRACGAEKAGPSGRRLHVHHLVAEDDADNPHEPTNLISLCSQCHQNLEGLSVQEQLNRCDIQDREELKLTGEVKRWFDSTREKFSAIKNAPSPRPGMFAEAQKVMGDDS